MEGGGFFNTSVASAATNPESALTVADCLPLYGFIEATLRLLFC